jgi:hypothetical protein
VFVLLAGLAAFAGPALLVARRLLFDIDSMHAPTTGLLTAAFLSLSLGLCDQSGLEVWPSLLNPHQHQTSRRPAATTEWQAVWPAELLSNPLLSCCRQACMQLQFARPVNLLYVYRMDYFKVQMLC